MKLPRKITYSLVIALIIFFSAFFAKIVPCQTSPNVPNPKYTWDFCSINPDTEMASNLSKLYLGYTPSLAQTYALIIAISFIATFLIIHFVTKSKE